MAVVSISKNRSNAIDFNYGGHAEDMQANPKVREDIRDRAAYVYVTGQFPSHLRSNYMGILRAICVAFNRPVALDGRSGSIKLTSAYVNDLELEAHPMVKQVRASLAEGYLIRHSHGALARRQFSKVYMYRPTGTGNDLLVVNSDGSVKHDWD